MGLRILHVAPLNTSGVPITFVGAERDLGHDSRLITMAKDRRNYQEDICLQLPLLDFWGTRMMKRFVSHPSKLEVKNKRREVGKVPLVWRPNGAAEDWLVRLREFLWQPKLKPVFQQIGFWDFDVYQFDGGLEFFRDGRTVSELKKRGKTVICCYLGSDLRTRGVIQAIDELSDLNITLELDHLELHPNIRHVFFPFEVDRVGSKLRKTGTAIRVGHAPTNRLAKGSGQIIEAIQILKRETNIELDLIENVSYEESLRRKALCDIFVDQIGDLGYGLNSVESLAMGIPTCSCLVQGFEDQYPDHPFIVVDARSIVVKLRDLIFDKELRESYGSRGRTWIKKYHDSKAVIRRIHEYAGLSG